MTAKKNAFEQSVRNFRIEPPKKFLGRGCHPKLGSLKKELSKDITINISKNAPIPKINISGNYS